jgi:hypothetical protein
MVTAAAVASIGFEASRPSIGTTMLKPCVEVCLAMGSGIRYWIKSGVLQGVLPSLLIHDLAFLEERG